MSISSVSGICDRDVSVKINKSAPGNVKAAAPQVCCDSKENMTERKSSFFQCLFLFCCVIFQGEYVIRIFT